LPENVTDLQRAVYRRTAGCRGNLALFGMGIGSSFTVGIKIIRSPEEGRPNLPPCKTVNKPRASCSADFRGEMSGGIGAIAEKTQGTVAAGAKIGRSRVSTGNVSLARRKTQPTRRRCWKEPPDDEEPQAAMRRRIL